jgi:hypothetical protein
MFAFYVGDRLAHLSVSNYTSSRPTHFPLPLPLVDKSFYRWGLDCRVIEVSDLENFILPPAEKQGMAIIGSLTSDLAIHRGRLRLTNLLTDPTTVGVAIAFLSTEPLSSLPRGPMAHEPCP